MDEIEPGLKISWITGMQALCAAWSHWTKPPEEKCWVNAERLARDSYTVQIFRQVKEKSADLDAFLQNLSARGPGASYERTGPNTIKATYKNCGCDLVRLGLVKSPALCECSAANLRENLEQSWGRSASVEVESSILRGGTACVLRVTLGDEIVEPE